MDLTIFRRLKFCAGHRLVGHEGKCRFFHGHSYTVEIHLSGTQLDAVGRLLDFADLKQRAQGWLDENWDHGFLLWDQDENGIAAMNSVEPSKVFLLPQNPTAEVLAHYLLEQVCPQLFDDLPVTTTQVTVWENEETAAIARR